MPEEKKAVDNSAEEKAIKDEQLNEDEKSIHSKAIRSKEDIEKIFIDNYGYTEGDPFLAKAVERELAHGKSMSKLIGQKIHYREKYNRDIKKDDKTDKTDDNDDKSITEEDAKEFRTKAAQDFVDYLGEKFPKLPIKDVYEKVKGEYKDSGDEKSQEDFLNSLKTTFKKVYPNENEDIIREDERKKVRKEDKTPDFSNLNSPKEGEPVKAKSYFAKKDSIKDWYPKKD